MDEAAARDSDPPVTSRLAVVSVSEWTAFAESIVMGPLTAILMIASWVTFGTTPPDQLAAVLQSPPAG